MISLYDKAMLRPEREELAVIYADPQSCFSMERYYDQPKMR